MIPNYEKYIFYVLITTTVIGIGVWCKAAIEAYKDNAVKAALGDIKAQQRDITIGNQDNVIKQQSVVFRKAQQIMRDSSKKQKEISSASSISEKVNVRYGIIEEMNCRINNFSDESICVKSVQ